MMAIVRSWLLLCLAVRVSAEVPLDLHLPVIHDTVRRGWMDRDSIETNTHTHSNNATTQPVAVVGVNHKKKDANVFEHRDLESLGVKDPNRKVRHVRRVVRTCSN